MRVVRGKAADMAEQADSGAQTTTQKTVAIFAIVALIYLMLR